ncbi:MAG TPA: hypothetical protein VGF67_19475 [Ktedonobacteraceae bacterium]|jgi:hypothetical protein
MSREPAVDPLEHLLVMRLPALGREHSEDLWRQAEYSRLEAGVSITR